MGKSTSICSVPFYNCFLFGGLISPSEQYLLKFCDFFRLVCIGGFAVIMHRACRGDVRYAPVLAM